MEYSKFRGISLLSVVGKIYAGTQQTVHKVTEGFTDDEQDQILKLLLVIRKVRSTP